MRLATSGSGGRGRPCLIARLRQRHWARVLERWAPERGTLATAAAILGVSVDRLARSLSPGLGRRDLTAGTLLARRDVVAALRGTGAHLR